MVGGIKGKILELQEKNYVRFVTNNGIKECETACKGIVNSIMY